MKLLVAAVSTNANSFGLRNMVILSDDGRAWNALANSIRVLPNGTLIEVPDGSNVVKYLTGIGCEIPEEAIAPPRDLFQFVRRQYESARSHRSDGGTSTC